MYYAHFTTKLEHMTMIHHKKYNVCSCHKYGEKNTTWFPMISITMNVNDRVLNAFYCHTVHRWTILCTHKPCATHDMTTRIYFRHVHVYSSHAHQTIDTGTGYLLPNKSRGTLIFTLHTNIGYCLIIITIITIIIWWNHLFYAYISFN